MANSSFNCIQKKLVFILLVLFVAGCVSTNQPPQQTGLSFERYNQTIDREYQAQKNKIAKRLGLFKVMNSDVVFHSSKENSGGFFQIRFSMNQKKSLNTYYTPENQGENFFNTLLSQNEDGSWSILGQYTKPGNTVVKLYMYQDNFAEQPVLVHQFELNVPLEKTEHPNIVKAWVKRMISYYKYLGYEWQRSPRGRWEFQLISEYHRHWLIHAPGRYGVDVDIDLPDNESGRQDIDVFSLLSGGLAIRESLQLDALRNAGYQKLEPVHDISQIQGAVIPSHPFKEMMQGKTSQSFPISALVPHDNYYVHITSFDKALEFFDLLNEKVDLFYTGSGQINENRHIKERLLKQLGHDPNSVRTRLFGDLLIEDLALTGEDPYFDNGTGFSMILKTRQPIRDEIDRIFKRVKQTQTAEEQTTTYHSVQIRSLVSDDHTISSHWAIMGPYAVNSNRLASLKRIIDVQQKLLPSMQENDDFRYMRTIFKGQPTDEDLFVYLSDSFVRKIIGPRWIIGKLRRLAYVNELSGVNNAILMRRNDHRMDLPTVDGLIKDRYLDKSLLPLGYSSIAIHPQTGTAYSKTFGSINHLIPINEMPLERVSEWEMGVYRDFLKRYNSLWREYFDPIGIRIKMDDQIRVEIVILPLINNSIYEKVREIVGTTPIQFEDPEADNVIASLGISMGKGRLEKKFTGEFNEIVNSQLAKNGQKPIELLGDKVQIDFYDHDLLFHINHAFLMEETRLFTRPQSMFVSLLLASVNLPITLSIDLKEPEYFKEIGGLDRISNVIRYQFHHSGIEFDRVQPYKGQSIYTATVGLWAVEMKFYIAQIGNQLVLASKRYPLEQKLGNHLQHLTEKKKVPLDYTANASLLINPNGFNQILPQMEEGFIRGLAQISQNNMKRFQALVLPIHPQHFDFNAESMKYFGYTLESPLGDEYHLDPKLKKMKSSKIGYRFNHTVPTRLDVNSQKAFIKNRLKKTRVNFSFTDEGIRTMVIIDR